MNTITNSKKQAVRTTIGQIRELNNETAFIGKCGSGPENELYLITYGSIFLASDPRKKQWSSLNCEVYVDRYVDVEIKIVEKH